jgi:hypothetical protein
MISPQPSGSIIKVQPTNLGGYRLSWDNPVGSGLARYGSAAFLIFWLCGWAAGECFAIWALVKGSTPGFAKLFLLVWLTFWTFGGFAAITQVRLLLSKPRPNELVLEKSQLTWQPGTAALPLRKRSTRRRSVSWKAWQQTFRINAVVVPREQVTNIKLDRWGARQCLTFDRGADRFEIGESLREPEREWLHELLLSWKQSPG